MIRAFIRGYLRNILCLLAMTLLLAQGALAADRAIEQLEWFIKNVQSAQGRFEQISDGGESKSTGQFAFKRPAHFRWATEAPFEQLIISDAKTLYQYDADLEQLIRRPLGQVLGESPAMILFGHADLAASFELQELSQQAGKAWLKATPKKPDSGFQYLELAFKNNLPVEIKIIDLFGKTTLIHLSHFQSNLTLKNQFFQFVPPKGTDIVEMQ